MPFGQLPILEVDGLTLCQGHAINRYLARKFGGYITHNITPNMQPLCQILYQYQSSLYQYYYSLTGYAGKTEWEQARVDMIGDCIEDFVHPCLLAVRATKPETKVSETREKKHQQSKPLFQIDSGYLNRPSVYCCLMYFAISSSVLMYS